MSFSSGLSGIAAANKDLSVTGNNIANASTVGFKASRTEFGDAYTSSMLGMGQDQIGSGVRVDNIGQKFQQGGITQTNSVLDLAIDGTGFFVMNHPNEATSYTRAGIFGMDKEGYIVNNSGARLQGYGAQNNSVVKGILTDLQVKSGNQPPRGTHQVDARVNVPAGASVLQSTGKITTTNGLAIGAAQTGPLADTITTLSTIGFPTTAGLNNSIWTGGVVDTVGAFGDGTGGTLAGGWTPSGGDASMTFDIELQGAHINSGLSSITGSLQPFNAATTYTGVAALVSAINSSILADSNLAGKIIATETALGEIQFETIGTYATDGTQIVNITDSPGTIIAGATYLNFGVPTITTPVAGTDLFANGGSIDLRSDPGVATSIQGNIAAGLIYANAFIGTQSTLTASIPTSSADPSGLPGFGDTMLGGETMVYAVTVGATTVPVTTTAPAGGWGSEALFAAQVQIDINAALGGAAPAFPNVSATINGSGRIELIADNTNPGYGPQPLAVQHVSSTMPFDMETLGLALTSSNPPSLVLGDPPAPQTNELDISVDGAAPITITVPAATYANTADVVSAINTQILVTPGLSGQIQASEVNGRLIFERTTIGAFPFDIDITGTAEALTNFGLDSTLKTMGTDPIDRAHSFRVNLTVPLPDEEDRSGSVVLSLDENIQSIEQLAAAINRELAIQDPEDYIGVKAEVTEDSAGNKKLQFVATVGGEGSQISVTNLTVPDPTGTYTQLSIDQLYGLLQVDQYDASLLDIGEPAVSNGYPEQEFTLVDPDGVEQKILIPAETHASVIAAQLTAFPGVTASATTQVTLKADSYVNGSGMNIFINGQVIEANDFDDMIDEINEYQQTSLNSITAELDPISGDIMLTSSIGVDITVSIESTTPTDQLEIQGIAGTTPQIIGGFVGAQTAARVGGEIDIVLNEGYEMIDPDPMVLGLFNGLTAASFQDYIINEFNPDDPETYNESASISVYDSLGNQHQLQMFYVKDEHDPSRPLDLSSWTVYAQIDGENVGDPDASLLFPGNIAPTIAQKTLYFNADGTVDNSVVTDWLISNWDPVNEDGDPTGAYASLNVAEGASLPLPDPNLNSNFEISFGGTTQYGGPFARYDFQQDGYASGRLKDIEIDDEGMIYARYTNGEDQVLGQVAIASFTNQEGLIPIGSTEWSESSESGNPTIGEAGSGILGDIRAASLEDSTVDLSEQLVHLIIAQRNYQASAKTIETSNAVTQTIINLR